VYTRVGKCERWYVKSMQYCASGAQVCVMAVHTV
jgi:hypothetical protein